MDFLIIFTVYLIGGLSVVLTVQAITHKVTTGSFSGWLEDDQQSHQKGKTKCKQH